PIGGVSIASFAPAAALIVAIRPRPVRNRPRRRSCGLAHVAAHGYHTQLYHASTAGIRAQRAPSNTNEFRAGLKIILDGDPFAIVENEFVKPGKGQAFNRVRIRNLKTGRVVDRTFKSGDTVEAADVVD